MRAFMAIKTPTEISQEVSKVQNELKKEGFYGSWPSPSNVHMTLFFFGDISPEKAKKISEVMDEVSRQFNVFLFEINKIGVFPPRGLPRVIWLGCEKNEEVQRLYKGINDSLKKVGFKFEERFTPHITVGRIKGVPKNWREKVSGVDLKQAEFECNTLELLSSKLTPKGAIYTVVHQSVLGGLEHER